MRKLLAAALLLASVGLAPEAKAQAIVGYVPAGGCGTVSYSTQSNHQITLGPDGKLCADVTVSATATIDPFVPTGQASLAVTNSSARVALPSGGATAILQNTGTTATVYVLLGGAGVVATTGAYPILPGQAIAFGVGSNADIAAITATGTSTLSITTGDGLPVISNAGGGGSGGGGGAVTIADGASVTLGTTTDAACSTDNGACTLEALTKRLIQRITTAIAGTTMQPISAATLPLPTGAASLAKQPAFGTAGTASADVITVQGIAGGTAQPISGTVAATESGTWTVQPGNTANTTPWLVNTATGLYPVTQSTSPWVVSNSGTFAVQAAQSGTWNVGINAGTAVIGHIICDSGCSSSTAPADESSFTAGVTPQGTVGGFFQTTATANALTNGQMGAFQTTANRALFSNLRNAAGTEVGTAGAPLRFDPTGTTTQPVTGSGSAGSAAVGVLTVQGIASMTKLLVTPDSVALPANQSVNVSQFNGVTPLMGNGIAGTGAQRVVIASDNTAFSVNAVESGSWNVGLLAGSNIIGKTGIDQTTPGTTNGIYLSGVGSTAIAAGNGVAGAGVQRVTIASDNTAFTVNAAQSGTWNLTNISGTVSLPTGAATSALQPTNAAQGSTTASQTGPLAMGAVTASAPTYTTAQTNPLSLDTAGNLRVNVVTGGAGGGAMTVADGADVAEGAKADVAYTGSGSASVVAILKGIYSAIASNLLPTGTAGTPATTVLTMQGISGMTPVNTTSNTAQVNGVTTLTGAGATGTGAQRVTAAQDTTTIAGSAPGTAGTASANVVTVQGIASATPVIVQQSTGYPVGSTPITISGTGTTGATTATLAANATLKTYICGFSIRANATAAATGNATITGTITGTLNFTQWTAPNASGIGINEQVFMPCVPSSATNTAIAIISAAPGTGGVVSVTGWGYQAP